MAGIWPVSRASHRSATPSLVWHSRHRAPYPTILTPLYRACLQIATIFFRGFSQKMRPNYGKFLTFLSRYPFSIGYLFPVCFHDKNQTPVFVPGFPPYSLWQYTCSYLARLLNRWRAFLTSSSDSATASSVRLSVSSQYSLATRRSSLA